MKVVKWPASNTAMPYVILIILIIISSSNSSNTISNPPQQNQQCYVKYHPHSAQPFDNTDVHMMKTGDIHGVANGLDRGHAGVVVDDVDKMPAPRAGDPSDAPKGDAKMEHHQWHPAT